MAVYFKFSSWSKENYDTVVLDTTSPFISVGELKQAIIKKKKIDKSNQLVLTNAQTNEEYKEDSQLIQKNTSVLVRLIPIINQLPQQPATNATASKNPRDPYKRGGNDDDFGTAFWEESNPELAQQEAIQQLPAGSEEDKIFAVINQAGDFPMASLKGQVLKQLPKKIPPVGYVCFRCNQPGHFIYDCPTNGDPNYNFQRKPVTMYGVPKSFLVQNNEGKAFEFKPNEGDFSKLVGGWNKNETQSIPKELTCPLCKKLLNNAVMIPCCNETSCDDCIRSQLMEKTNFHCPLCNTNLVPDQLLPNKAVRRSVESYKIGKPIDTNLLSSSSNTSASSSASSSSSSSSSHNESNKHYHEHQISPIRSPTSTEIASKPVTTEYSHSKNVAEAVSNTTSSTHNTTSSNTSGSGGSDDRVNRKRRSPSPSYPSSSSYDRHPPSEEYRRYGRAPADYRDREYDYRDRDRYYRGSPRRFGRSRSRSPKRRFRSRSPPPAYYRRSRSRSPFRYRDRRDRTRSRSRDRDRAHNTKKRSVERKEEKDNSNKTTTSADTTPSTSVDKSSSSQKTQEDKLKSTSHSKESSTNNKDEKKVSSSSSSTTKKDTSSSSRRSRSRSRDRDRPYRRRSRSRERIERKPSSSSSSDKKSDVSANSNKTPSGSTTQTESKKAAQ